MDSPAPRGRGGRGLGGGGWVGCVGVRGSRHPVRGLGGVRGARGEVGTERRGCAQGQRALRAGGGGVGAGQGMPACGACGAGSILSPDAPILPAYGRGGGAKFTPVILNGGIPTIHNCNLLSFCQLQMLIPADLAGGTENARAASWGEKSPQRGAVTAGGKGISRGALGGCAGRARRSRDGAQGLRAGAACFAGRGEEGRERGKGNSLPPSRAPPAGAIFRPSGRPGGRRAARQGVYL